MRVLTRILNALIILAMSARLLLFRIAPEYYNEKFSCMSLAPWPSILFGVAILLIVLNLYCVYRWMQIMRFRRHAIEFDNKNGVSSISIDAIERRLLQILSDPADVSHPRINLSLPGKGKALRCNMEFSLRRSRDISGRTDELKNLIREAFLRMLPGGPGIEISASVVDLVNEDAGAKKSKPDFSGPVYPDAVDAADPNKES